MATTGRYLNLGGDGLLPRGARVTPSYRSGPPAQFQ